MLARKYFLSDLPVKKTLFEIYLPTADGGNLASLRFSKDCNSWGVGYIRWCKISYAQ